MPDTILLHLAFPLIWPKENMIFFYEKPKVDVLAFHIFMQKHCHTW